MGLPQLRWWDNHSWTEFTSAARTPLLMQDQAPLAYADDELPSRRSQREQRDREEQYLRLATESNVTQPPLSKAELVSTLRQLEPPKPQQIERNQPAPEAAAPQQQAPAQPAASQPAAAPPFTAAPAAPPAAAPAQPATAQQAPAQASPAEPAPAQPQAARPAAHDPFSEFLTPSEAEEPRYARSSANHTEEPSTHRDSWVTASEYHPMDAQADAYSTQASYARQANAQRRLAGQHVQIYTPAVWIIALIPLLQMVLILLGVSSGAGSIPMVVPFVGIIVVPYIGAIVLAYFDRRELLRSGHRKPAHWAWMILTIPVYLILRSKATNREFGKGSAPITIWVALCILQAMSVIAVPGILISAVPEVFRAEVEQSIVADAAIVGTKLAVTCPTPAAQIGVQFTCVGVTDSGNKVDINVSLQRANGWIDWRVDSQVWQSDLLK